MKTILHANSSYGIFLKRYVFISVLKLDNELLCLIKSGREFHKLDAAKGKHMAIAY